MEMCEWKQFVDIYQHLNIQKDWTPAILRLLVSSENYYRYTHMHDRDGKRN